MREIVDIILGFIKLDALKGYRTYVLAILGLFLFVSIKMGWLPEEVAGDAENVLDALYYLIFLALGSKVDRIKNGK